MAHVDVQRMILGRQQLINIVENRPLPVQDLMDDAMLRFCQFLELGTECKSERLEPKANTQDREEVGVL
jgi:hypothetical protein